MTTAKARLQNDIEHICEMAKDDIDAALWHWGTDKSLSLNELQTAIENIKMAILLAKET